MKTKVIGIFIFLFVIIAAIVCGGGWSNFIHIPGAGFVVILSVALTLMKYRKGDEKSETIGNLKKYSIFSSLIGCLIGFVQIGWNVTDPMGIPKGAAVAILTVFYGLIFYCIIDTFADRKKMDAMPT